MRKLNSKTEAAKEIDEFFLSNDFSSLKLRKIIRLAMKYKIRLGRYRKLFCKSCLSQLKGKTRISKTHKAITCQSCKYTNKFKM